MYFFFYHRPASYLRKLTNWLINHELTHINPPSQDRILLLYDSNSLVIGLYQAMNLVNEALGWKFSGLVMHFGRCFIHCVSNPRYLIGKMILSYYWKEKKKNRKTSVYLIHAWSTCEDACACYMRQSNISS